MTVKAQQPLLNPDELNAIENANSPSITNVFLTELDLTSIAETLSNSWTIGEITDDFYTFSANISNSTAKPGIRYNKTEGSWEFSNDGGTWESIGVGNNFFDKNIDTTDDITEGVKKFLTTSSVRDEQLDASNTPSAGQLLTWNGAKFEWIDASSIVVPTDTTIGTPSDGTYSDGLLPFTPSTERSDAFDDINEVLKELVPAAPESLTGLIGSPTPLVSGKISGGTTNSGVNLINYIEGQSISNIYTSQNFVSSIPEFGQADEGILEVEIDQVQVDTFDLGSNFSEAERNGSQSYTPLTSGNGYLEITSVGKFNNFSKWQSGEGNLRVGLSSGNSDLSLGEHTYKVIHTIGASENGATSESSIFIDKHTGRPNISTTPQISEFSGSFKYLSGVKLYGIGSSFKISFDSEKCFEYTYVENMITLSMPGLNSFTMNYDDSSISGVTLPVPSYDDVVTCTDKEVTLNDSNEVSDDARILIVPRDPHGTGFSGQSTSENRMINTYGSISTDSMEYFVDENYRLPIGDYDTTPSVITGEWSSASPLLDGNAQVYNHILKYPEEDYTTVLPQQILDYTSFSGNQTYIRAFRDGAGHQSGNLIFSGIAVSDLNTNVRVEIKLPGVTGWLDLGVGFNASTYTASDGDGCRTSVSGGNFGWTSGGTQYSTVFSGNMIIVKITLLNNLKEITQIQSTWV